MKYLAYILLIVLVSCSTYSLTGIKGKSATYTVKAGEHKMKDGRVLMLKDNEYNFTLVTDSSWVWDVPEKNGFSKITGIGWTDIETTKHSARLVYINKANNVHELWSYFYVSGISPMQNHDYWKKLCDVEIGQKYYGTIRYSNGWYSVSVGDNYHSVKASYHKMPYLMNPHIGGTYTIEHDWKVQITYY